MQALCTPLQPLYSLKSLLSVVEIQYKYRSYSVYTVLSFQNCLIWTVRSKGISFIDRFFLCLLFLPFFFFFSFRKYHYTHNNFTKAKCKNKSNSLCSMTFLSKKNNKYNNKWRELCTTKMLSIPWVCNCHQNPCWILQNQVCNTESSWLEIKIINIQVYFWLE